MVARRNMLHPYHSTLPRLDLLRPHMGAEASQAMISAPSLQGLEAGLDAAQRVGEEWMLIVVIMPSTILSLSSSWMSTAAHSRCSPHVSLTPLCLSSPSLLDSGASLLDRAVLTSTACRAGSPCKHRAKGAGKLAIPNPCKVLYIVCDGCTSTSHFLSIVLSRACTAPFERPRTDQPTDLHPSCLAPSACSRHSLRLLHAQSRQSTGRPTTITYKSRPHRSSLWGTLSSTSYPSIWSGLPSLWATRLARPRSQ
ncbi:hypothetical protein J3F83DRAFT_406213 [Trichoderma novae-zelandiae]